MDSISAGPYNPVGDAPGNFSAATTPLGNIRAPLAATRKSRSVVGCAPRMDSPLAGTHNPVGCAPGSNSAAQAYGVGSPRDLAVPRQGPNACASSYPQPAAGETWQAGDNALSQPPLPRAVGNTPQGILAVDNVLPAPVPTGQRAARDFAQPASRAREIFPGDATGARDFAQPGSRAREIFPGDVTGARAYEPPAGGCAPPGAPVVAVPGPTGETAIPGVDHPGLFSSRAAGRKRRGGPVEDTRAPNHRLTSLPTVSQPPGVPGPALGNKGRDPNPVALLRHAAAMTGFSLQGPPQDPTDCGRSSSVGVEPNSRDRAVPAALGAPPGEESYPVPMDTASALTVDPDMESVMSDSVLSLADSEGAERGGHWGSEAQALLRRYLPQFYAPEPSQETVPPTQASLLFRDRRDQAADIPLTQDFIQEYDRVSKEPRLRTPATLRRAFRFRPQDFEKFFSPEVLSPEILRVADRRPQGNPLQDRRFKECDKKWAKMAEASRTSMRFAAYSGALANCWRRRTNWASPRRTGRCCAPYSCPSPKPTRLLRLPGRPSIPRGRGASRPYRRWAFLAKTPMKSASPSRLKDRTSLRGGHCKSLTTKPPTDNGPMKRPGVFISPGSPRGFRHPGAHTRAPRLNARSQSRSQDRTLATAAAADTVAVAEPGPTRPAGIRTVHFPWRIRARAGLLTYCPEH